LQTVLFLLVAELDELGEQLVKELLKDNRIEIIPYTFRNGGSTEKVISGKYFEVVISEQLHVISLEFPEVMVIDNLSDFEVFRACSRNRIRCHRCRDKSTIIDQLPLPRIQAQ